MHLPTYLTESKQAALEGVKPLHAMRMKSFPCKDGTCLRLTPQIEMDAAQATDALLYNREAICAIAAKHGLIASFVPKLSASTAGSGAHLHLSIWKVLSCPSLVAKGFFEQSATHSFDPYNHLKLHPFWVFICIRTHCERIV